MNKKCNSDCKRKLADEISKIVIEFLHENIIIDDLKENIMSVLEKDKKWKNEN